MGDFIFIAIIEFLLGVVIGIMIARTYNNKNN